MRVSPQELAKETGLHLRTVGRNLKSLGIAKDSVGKFDRAEALAALRSNVDPHRVVGHAIAGRGNVEGREISAFGRAKARSEEARAEKIELDVQKRRGDLLPRRAVEEAGRDIIRRAGQHFLAIGQRAAPRLVGLSDPRRIAEILDDEARATLSMLADLGRLADDITDAVLA